MVVLTRQARHTARQWGRRCLAGGLLGLGLMSLFAVTAYGLPQYSSDTTHLTVRPREMATGTRTDRAGEHWLDSVAGRVYVPQRCVGARRCPLVVAAFHVPAPRRWHREQAETHGMIYLEPCGGTFESFDGRCNATVKGIDSALKLVLPKFAIDPDKIVLMTEELNQWFVRGGGHLPEVFSRAVELWWPDVADTIVPVGPQPAEKPQFRAIVGVTEFNGPMPVFVTAFRNVQTLHRAGYPVVYAGTLRRHANCREDFEDMWQWFADSWTTPVPATQPASLVPADSTLLSEQTLIQLLTFWLRFREADERNYGDYGPYDWGWNTVDTLAGFKESPPAPTRMHRKDLTIPFGPGLQPMHILIADMPALAAADPAIAADLAAADLTAQQEETARIAFIQALALGALVMKGEVRVEPTSTVGRNIRLLEALQTRPNPNAPSMVEQLQQKMAECHAG